MPSKGKSKGKSDAKKGDKNKSKGARNSRAKGVNYLEIPPIQIKDVRCKITCTSSDIADFDFDHFRCSQCKLALDCFQSFIDHSCWRKYYTAKYHLGCTQAFGCRACELVFYSHADYAGHLCYDNRQCDMPEWWQPEEVIPISYQRHQDYYIKWARRSELESTSHEPDFYYVCRCCRCSRRFKSKSEFLLHSCCLLIALKPAFLRRLKTCMHCKFVFLNESEYTKHIDYCDPRKAFCIDFALSATEISCQQFVIGRHCFDFDHYIHNEKFFKARDFVLTEYSIELSFFIILVLPGKD